METLKEKIENAKSTEDLNLIVESLGLKSKIARILDDTFWYIDLNTFEKQQEFMLKKLTQYPELL